MDSDNDSSSIVLNVYELAMTPSDDNDHQEQPTRTASSSLVSFFSKLLPRAGLGAYHTSLDVNNYCYAYGMGGIAKTSIANKHAHLPPSATFQQSITLGSIHNFNANNFNAVLNQCINTLRRTYFTENGYHVVHRNCNHFTETLATALIVAEDLMNQNPPELKTYPKWINRLAKTGSNFMNHGGGDNGGDNGDNGNRDENAKGASTSASISVCNVVQEARIAAGLEGKISWELTSTSTSTSTKKTRKNQTNKSIKKELTDAQKQMLAKLNRK